MKLLCFVLLTGSALLAQNGGSPTVVWLDQNGNRIAGANKYKLVYQVSYVMGLKVLSYSVYDCDPPASVVAFLEGPSSASVFGRLDIRYPNFCALLRHAPEDFSGVNEVVGEFLDWVLPNQLPFKIDYGALAKSPVRRSLATIQPVAPPNPYMVIEDGLSSNLLKFDLTAGSTVATVALPESAIGPLAIRPTATPPSNEVWVANGGLQVTIADLGTQTVLANIATPSIAITSTPAGIVFTNDGATGFEAVRYASADSSGNNGALLIFDAVNRLVTSTFQLKYPPAAILMAPDALTVYLLSTGGEITYYDVLSGTADLSASTFTPGMNGGYEGYNVFIHANGTQLFWNVGIYLEVFDLTTRKVVNQFSSGLPTTSGVTLEVSQDGSTATMSNGQGTVVLLDTQSGIVEATIQNGGPTQAFPGN
jgi:hypothetical protein